MSDVQELVRGIEQVSSLPVVFMKVNERIEDPESSAADIGEIIDKDPALTSKLLQLANSAFYGFGGRIETVTRAISIIGFKQLKDLVLAISVRTTFGDIEDNPAIDMKSFWEHSMACGIACRVLSVYQGSRASESTFVAGFLHDLGRLILLEQFPEKCLQLYSAAREECRPVTEIENEVFGFTHAEVGAELIKMWNLPPSLAEAVAFHHDPTKANEHVELAAIVHVADVVVHSCDIGGGGNFRVPPLDKHAWKQTGLKNSVLEPAIKKLHEQFDDSVSFLN